MKKNKTKLGKIRFIMIGVLSLLLCGWYVFAHQKSPEQRMQFTFAQIELGNFELTVSSTGTLAAVETVEIGTQVSGTIDKLMVDYNDTVQNGDVLAVLDQSLFKVAIQNAKAGLLKAQAELKEAECEYKRNKPLYEKGYISEQEFLPFDTAVNISKASLLSAKATLQQAEIDLEHTVISSPIDGIVIDRSVDAGQTVAASLSTPTLFLVAKDLAQMQIETNVDETDIGQIQKGQQVRFSVQSYSDRIFTGTVRQIRLQPETVDNVVTYTVIVEASNESGLLLPGMTATADFIIHDTQNALLVPVAALQFTQGMENGESNSRHLYCQDHDGMVKAVSVDIVQSDGLVTVVSGKDISQGMKVAIGSRKTGEDDKKDSGFSLSSLIGGGMKGMSQEGGPGGSGPGPRP